MKGLYCADIITFNTVALKGSIRDVCRALYTRQVPRWLEIKYEEDIEGYGKPTDETSKLYERYAFGKYLDISDDICKRIDVEGQEEILRKEYADVFEYVDIINGTIVSIGVHPCGVACSSIPLDENMGLLTLSTCENPVTMLNMKEVDSLNYVKLDILGLDNVQLINETCDLVGIERLTPQNVDDDDLDVWTSIKEDTTAIFQWDGSGSYYIKDLFSDKTINNIRKVYPKFKYIDLMSCGNGAIRPAGASYRDQLAKGIFRDNGNKELNEMLAPTLGYLVYQEQILSFLHEFCGYTMGEADIVRRGFAKKTGTEQFIPNIKNGFIKTMKEKYNMSEDKSKIIVENFINVIIDASSYLFSLNHSLPYSYIGYICGYLRYYYPLEFITTMLNINNGDSDRTSKAIDYAKKHNISIKPPKFRYSKAEYFMDKSTNSIFKGLSSIKYMNEDVANSLYDLRNNEYNNFLDVLIDLFSKTTINSRQLDILITMDYFNEFGKSQKLFDILSLYNNIIAKKLKSKKGEVSFNKSSMIYDKNIIEKYATEKSKDEKYKQYKVSNAEELCSELMSSISNMEMASIDKVKKYIDSIGDCNYSFEDYSPTTCVVIDVIAKYKIKRAIVYNIASGKKREIRIGEGYFDIQGFEKLDVIDVYHTFEKPKKEQIEVEVSDGYEGFTTKKKWVKKDGVFELWCDEYNVLSKCEIEELNIEEYNYKMSLT